MPPRLHQARRSILRFPNVRQFGRVSILLHTIYLAITLIPAKNMMARSPAILSVVLKRWTHTAGVS